MKSYTANHVLIIVVSLWSVYFLPLNALCQISSDQIEQVPLEDLQYVKAIVEDHQGLIWFGTGHGLFRFDGTHLLSFTHVSNDTSSISDNFIEKLFVDHQGHIWLSTGHGLTCFNPLTGKSRKYYHDAKDPNSLSNDYLGRIAEDKHNCLWIGSSDGLNKLDPQTGDITVFKHDENDVFSISSGRISSVFIDHLQRYWIGTDRGLNRFDPLTNKFHHYLQGVPSFSMRSWIIMDILEDHDGILWLATWGEGLVRFDPNTGAYASFWENPEKKHRGDHNVIYNIAFSDEEKQALFVASSENHFSMFDLQRNDFILPSGTSMNGPVTQEGISLLLDAGGNLWIGSKGLTFKITAGKKLFSEFNFSSTLNHDCLSAPLAIFEEKNKDGTPVLWLGTWTCGLIKAEYLNNKAFTINKQLKRHDWENYWPVTSILRDNSSILWVGTENGLFQQSATGDLEKKYTYKAEDALTLSHDFIQCMLQDHQKRFWVGTWNGLNLYDQAKNNFKRYFPLDNLTETRFSANNIEKISELPSGDLLVLADQKDIFKFETGINKFTRLPASFNVHADSIGFIKDLLIDTQGDVWCAGTQGVLRIKNTFSNPSYTIFTTVQGLSFDFTRNIIEDECGHIWISTRKGLNMFDRAKNAFTQFYSYDGLYASNTEGYMIKGGSGNIIVGYGQTEKNDAINYFNPCEWKNEGVLTPVIITGIKIFNKDKGLLSTGLNEQQIHLRSKDRMITFEFVELNYLPPEHNKYAYMLEGFDKHWNYAGSNTTATYTNLDGGDYTFKVKALNDVNTMKENIAMMSLSVTPLFYKTPWFYLLCIFLTVGIFYFLYTLRINQLKRLYAVRLAISHDLHDDIGSRLSSISILTQLADQKKSDPNFNISKFYDQVMKGTKEAMEIMNDIVWSVNPKYDKLNNTLIRMREYASEILEAKNIDFRIHAKAPLQDSLLTMKHRKDFYLIFKEAINNLAKYAECTMVNISIEKENDALILVIEDNGKGFDMDAIKKGNGMNTMQARADSIKGKLQIKSVVNQGTSIRLEVPVT